MKLLDCTLRDGGYYINWDFDRDLVDNQIEAFNHLPVEYLGEYFYCPVYVLERIKGQTNKMVSGANSIPQKLVMEWVSKRYYSSTVLSGLWKIIQWN